MRHLGDITKINGAEVPVVDCIIGGSPCQDLSVAGKRAGLEGERSGLFMEQVRIVKEMREHDIRTTGRTGVFVRPRYMVWENVPGALSSGTPKGEDFRIVLEEIARIADETACVPGPPKGKWPNAGAIVGNGYSICWKILDAQYWGVTYFGDDGVPVKLGTPQRRRRIALVADFGGDSAVEILSQFSCLPGDSEPRGQARESAAGDPAEGPGGTSYTLKIRGGREIDSLGKRAGKGALVQEELSGTLGVSQDQTLVQPVTLGHDERSAQFSLDGKTDPLTQSDYKQPPVAAYGLTTKGNGDAFLNPNTHTALYVGGGEAGQGYPATVQAYGVTVGESARLGKKPSPEKAPTLQAEASSDNQASVVYSLQGGGVTSQSSQGSNINEEVSFTLNAIDRHGVAYENIHGETVL